MRRDLQRAYEEAIDLEYPDPVVSETPFCPTARQDGTPAIWRSRKQGVDRCTEYELRAANDESTNVTESLR